VNTNFLRILVWLDGEIKPRSTDYEVDALITIRPRAGYRTNIEFETFFFSSVFVFQVALASQKRRITVLSIHKKLKDTYIYQIFLQNKHKKKGT